ncbi:MAG: hypothetical protein HZC55_13405 [Verrucomicrobia bacterium]|nr:hypothetical protein [Verrucomicrobiota bacterium]
MHAFSPRSVCFAFAVVITTPLCVAAATLQLSTPQATLSLDARGLSLAPANQSSPAIVAAGGPLWTMVIQTPSTPSSPGPQTTLSSSNQTSRQETSADSFKLIYDELRDNTRTWKISLTLEFRREGDGFVARGEIANNAPGWIVREFRGPFLTGIQAPPAEFPLLWPDGLGQRYATSTGAERTFVYPSGRGTMQWCSFAGAHGGLYLGSHDVTHGAKGFVVRGGAPGKPFEFSLNHQVFSNPGQRWTLPPLVVWAYRGDWHTAARHYRAWFDSVVTRRAAPAWAQAASGWVLCILKQQNGDVMWDYSDLDRLCDVADQRGLDVLGLFGWAHGGHDRFYPDYIPDPLMGGPGALKSALARARARGKRTILYANGQLCDASTDFYRYAGNEAIVLRENAEAVTSSIRKFNSSAPVVFVLGCNGAQAWEDRMLALALQAHQLGAAGILYDQLGVAGPTPCFATHHKHASPATPHAGGRSEMLRRIADHMKRLAPDFIVATEGVHDSLLDSTPFSHGWGSGFTPPPAAFYEGAARVDTAAGTTWPWMRDALSAFPELFRFTFPEQVMTLRHATPMLDRHFANYALTFGLRHEIETRWRADVRYLKDNVVPAAKDYADCTYWPPDVPMMQGTPPAEATRYLKAVTDFARRHADLLWRGRFVDTEGFTLTGAGLVAKAYRTEKQLGVLVWNPTGGARSARVDVPGARLVATSEPERPAPDPAAPLGARSVRLYVWDL